MDGTGSSTLGDIRRVGDKPPTLWPRRIGTVVLLVVVLVGALGFLGVHSATTSSGGHDYQLSVTYPRVARAGLDIPFRVHVHHDGGVSEDPTIAISSAYLRLFETQGWYPDADTITNDGSFVYLTFTAPPPGQDFTLEYDAYIQPGAQVGKSATVRLLINGHQVAETTLHTWLVP